MRGALVGVNQLLAREMIVSTFKALRIDKTDRGRRSARCAFADADLMEGDVTVRVTHSTVNYKDGLAITGQVAGGAALPDDPGHRFRGRRRDAATIPLSQPGDTGRPQRLGRWRDPSWRLCASGPASRATG